MRISGEDVKTIRKNLRMSQRKFSARYRLALYTLKSWEAGRRNPDKIATTYLLLIEAAPEMIADLVEQTQPRS